MFKFLRTFFNKPIDSADDLREYVDNDHFKQFSVTVAGITFTNVDGSSRSKIAASCSYGQKLLLIREPNNIHDSNAVKVLTEDERQLGYLSPHDASDVQAPLKGTSNMYDHVEAIFIESGKFLNDENKRMPYCRICIRKHYKVRQ